MKTKIEKEIYDLRCILNRMVSHDIDLTDERVIKLSVKLDKLLNVFHNSLHN